MSFESSAARAYVSDPIEDELRELRNEIESLKKKVARSTPEDRVCLVCFSGEWDRLFASFIIANGALAMGQEVDMYFTFWAAAALRDQTKSSKNKSFFEKMMGTMLQSPPNRAPLSRMNFGGLGRMMIQRRMKECGVTQLDELIEQAQELGAKIHLCEMSSDLLGVGSDEIVGDGSIDSCGVATFLTTALKGKAVLFI